VRVAQPLFTPLAAEGRPVVESALAGRGGPKEVGDGDDQR
jgi:cyanophycinase